MPSSILVIEDEPAISELISVNLQHAGHCPIRAYNAEQAQNLVSDVLPDLMLLDWMLPGKSGIAFARELRNNERTKHIPIIMLTARRRAGQGAGSGNRRGRLRHQAVSPKELMARIKAVLRRRAPQLTEDVATVCVWIRRRIAWPRAIRATTSSSISVRPNSACCISS